MSPRFASAITSRPASRASRAPLEHARSRPPVPLEERDLRLHDAGSAGRGLDGAQAELAHALGGVGSGPTPLEHGRVRVDAEAQVPQAANTALEPVAEGDHAAVHAFTSRRAPYSCRLVTSNPAADGVERGDGRRELGDRREQRDVGGDRRADLVAVGASRAAARGVDDHVDLAAVDELDDGGGRRPSASR